MTTRALWSFVVVVTLVGAVGCRRHVSTAGPGMNAKRENTLLADAARALSCDQRTLVATFEESVEKNYHAYRVDGCGQRYHALLHCTGICNWREAPERRATVDLQCPAAQLSRTYANRVFTVFGCGQSARYELSQGRLTPVLGAAGEVPPPPPPAP